MMTMTRSIDATSAEAGKMADLYRQHAPEAVRLAYLLTGDRATAEDLTQDAFVRMFGRFRDLRQPEAFEWYLRRTIVNLSRSLFRRRKVERTYLQRRSTHPAPAADDPEPRPDLWEALLRLPIPQRAAIVLRYYEDLTESRTAEILRCPVGTVKSLVSRGMARLREEVERDV